MSATAILKDRNFAGLILASTILGAAFPIQLILGGLAGLVLAPEAGLATLPSSVQTLAGLLAAAPFSLLMGRFGRRAGFALGGILTLLGGIAAVHALQTQSFFLLCAGHFLMGAGWASFQYFRFAAGELVAPHWRPVAISLMLSSLLVAALVGPQVFTVTKDALAPLPFAGAYAAICLIAVLGVLPLSVVRMPPPANKPKGPVRKIRDSLQDPGIRRAIGIGAVAQGVMVFLMIPTPIAMVGCGLSETTAGDVIRWHIVAMFAPSFVTGFLIQRFTARRVAAAGLVLLIFAAIIGALGQSAQNFYAALVVLGLGWNFAFISATSLLEAAVPEADKPRVQGANDTLIALVSTIGAFLSGFVLSHFGWAVLAVLSSAIVTAALASLTMSYRKVQQ